MECVLTGNSKQYLGKTYIEQRINKLSAEEVDNLFSTYKAFWTDGEAFRQVDHWDVFDGSLCHLWNEQSGRMERRQGTTLF